jgi:quercetin 2,3-dioxygenase
MITLRPADARGRTITRWLDSRHTFSFGGYHDPDHVRYRALRVINDDRVVPGHGFGTHAHRDMEIVTYVLSGQLRHGDSLGHDGVIEAGQVQRITAGTGITHSEVNPSATDPVHFLQIWIEPRTRGLAPAYEQTALDALPAAARQIVAGPRGSGAALTIDQDALIVRLLLAAGDEVAYPLAAGRHAWLHVVRGPLTLGQHSLDAGDGAAITGEAICLRSLGATEALLFDLG